MNLDELITLTLMQIRDGIVDFNQKSTTIKADYPNEVEIQVESVHDPIKIKFRTEYKIYPWIKEKQNELDQC